MTCFYGCVNHCAVHPDNTNATMNSIIFDDRNSVVVVFFGFGTICPWLINHWWLDTVILVRLYKGRNYLTI